MNLEPQVCTLKKFEEVEALLKKIKDYPASPSEIIIMIGNHEEILLRQESPEEAAKTFQIIKEALIKRNEE